MYEVFMDENAVPKYFEYREFEHMHCVVAPINEEMFFHMINLKKYSDNGNIKSINLNRKRFNNKNYFYDFIEKSSKSKIQICNVSLYFEFKTQKEAVNFKLKYC